MKITSVIPRHFGTQLELANALGVTQPYVSSWVTKDKIPPLQQLRIEILLRGVLKADKGIAPRVSRL